MQVAARTPPAALVLLVLPVATSLIEILPVTDRAHAVPGRRYGRLRSAALTRGGR
jgi:hypothetical protein